MTRLQFRQTIVVVVLTVGALSLPRMVARRWAASERVTGAQKLTGQAFLAGFGN